MKPFTIFILTPLYMIYKGGTFGGLFGGLAGTFIFPLVGTIVGAVWGTIAGLIMGTILGIFYALLDAFLGLHGLFRYRKWIVRLTGLTTFLLFPLVMQYIIDILPPSILSTMLILLPFTIAASIATAYSAVRWFDWLAEVTPRKLKIDQQDNSVNALFTEVYVCLVDAFKSKSKWLYYLTPIAAIAIVVYHFSNYPPQTDSIVIHVVAHAIVLTVGFAIFLLIFLYGLTLYMTVLILAANRLYFKADVHPLAYKNRLSVMAFFVTLFSTPIVTGFIGAPIAAIIATLAIRDYADWYNEASGKGKRKEKPKHDHPLVQQVSS